MKYLFRDRVPKERGLATYVKLSGDTHPDHHDYHPHYELYFRRTPLLQEIVLGGEVQTLGGCIAVLTAPFSIHAMSPAVESPQFERHIVYFEERCMAPLLPEGFLEKNGNCIFQMSEKDAHVLEKSLPGLFDEGLPERERALELALFFSRLDRLVPAAARRRFGQSRSYVPQVLRYLYENIASDLSIDSVAARFHVSRAKLDRDFRASVGHSLHRAVADLRLSHSMSLLRDTELSVGDISAACGFGAEAYFYSFFKRATGQTPLHYRHAYNSSIT